jgi:H+/gluconate symporter-like permease
LGLAREQGIDFALLYRVTVIGSGTLDSPPHNVAVVMLLAVRGTTHRQDYFDIVMVGIGGAIIALAVVAAGAADSDCINHIDLGARRTKASRGD